MVVESGIVAKVLSWLKPIRSAGQWIIGLIRLNSRVGELERHRVESSRDTSAAYRVCPSCDKRDFRLRDHYRSRPDIYGPRFLHEKWLCYTCGHAETNNIEEPD